ncbi:952_t:CDS:2, partial [Gigaspora margarita]
PSLKDAKLRTTKSGKIKTTMKHTMPFSPSSIHTKNVRITVTYVGVFLDTILYTCGMSFYNTCDLAFTKLINSPEVDNQDNQESDRQQSDDQQTTTSKTTTSKATTSKATTSKATTSKATISKATTNQVTTNKATMTINRVTISRQKDYLQSDYQQSDDQMSDELQSADEDMIIGSSGPIERSANKRPNETKVRSKRESTKDPIYELFQRVFVNDSWSCVSPIEKPYYSAGIFPIVCFLCGSKNVTKPTNNEWPLCARCGGKNKKLPKKWYKWRPKV